MPDLTPPPMSEEKLRQILLDALCRTPYKRVEEYVPFREELRALTSELMRTVLAARDEQWRQRLEPVKQGRHGTVMVDGAVVCCNENDREPCPQQPERRCASCPGNVPLYRIKEQG